MSIKDIVNRDKTSIIDYQRRVQPMINEGRHVYLRVVDLDDLHIKYDYPRIRLADGSVVADTSTKKIPSGGDDMTYEFPARELREKGEHSIAFKSHYSKSGRLIVDEAITIYRDRVMMFPAIKALFLVANYGRILEEVDERTGRRLLLAQQVEADAAAEDLEAEVEPEVEVVDDPEPEQPKPAFLKGSKAKKKKEK